MDKKILPKEYGGEVPLAEMVEMLKAKLKAQREQVLALDDMYIEIDEKNCPLVSEMNEELGIGLEGSFKKLIVDWMESSLKLYSCVCDVVIFATEVCRFKLED